MKKHLSYLCALFFLLSIGNAKAVEPPIQPQDYSYGAGAFNKMQLQQIDGYKLERSYVQSLDHLNNDERIYDASVEEDVAREGVLYNPHFLLEKINFVEILKSLLLI